MKDFWANTYWGNTAETWFIVLGIISGGILIVYLTRVLLVRRLAMLAAKTNSTLDDFIVSTLRRSVIPFLYVFIVFTGLSSLHKTVKQASLVQNAMMIVVAFFVLRVATQAMQFIVHTFLRRQEDGEMKQKQAGGLVIIVKALIWIIGAVFVINNLGYNVSTIIAGLGIGGIAIALAAQTILGDLFSYFVILFDRPFETGDFIIVDDKMGIVEYIGIKTTRLRTLGGEQLVCSNKDLTDSRVHNFKRMEKRRVVFTLRITYQTKADTLKSIPQIVKNIITQQSEVSYDRGNFSGFGDSSLDFEFVYYVLSADYNLFMDRQQAIYFDIFKTFEKSNIRFAYPTSTVFLNRDLAGVN